MIVKLLIEHHLEFLSLKGHSRGSPESTLVKMSKCWKSHVLAQMESRMQQHGRKYFSSRLFLAHLSLSLKVNRCLIEIGFGPACTPKGRGWGVL